MGHTVPVFENAPVSNPLADLLSNSLVLQQTAPCLPISSIFALAATSKSFKHIVYNRPEVFRYLDLSVLRTKTDASIEALSEDETLTEDEIYAAPLRKIFANLERRNILPNVRTLILDGLSVPAELVQQILAEDRFDVRILSIRGCQHLNERLLMQSLKYAVRSTRPENTPRVKGIYYFDPQPHNTEWDLGSRSRYFHDFVRFGRTPSSNTEAEDPWYSPTGLMFKKLPSQEWAETLKACEGIIAFDAVLCRGPRHDPGKTASYISPAIATVALGPAGCDTCHSSPESPGIFGRSPVSELPLLDPVPLHSSMIRAAQMPKTINGSTLPSLFVRCVACLKGRWCERCHKWWDEDCYTTSTIAQRTTYGGIEFVECTNEDGGKHIVSMETRKVLHGFHYYPK